MATKAKNSRMIGLALTTALASTALAGCAGKAAPPANVSAAKAETAITNGKSSKAIRHAEAAVEAEPRNAGFRAMLGAAYLDAGRFQSAATSFDDAMALGDATPRTALSLALALTANQKYQDAQAILSDWEGQIAASDLGLAFTLAGNPQRGIHILSNAIRSGDNTAKSRQNLAYSYAMAGQWREARLMAQQDVPAGQVGSRIEEWAAVAHSPDSARRIANLLNVEVDRSDAGQPVALALSNNPTAEQLASQATATADVEIADAAEYQVPAYSGAGELPALDMAEAPVRHAASVPAPIEAPAPARPIDASVALANYERETTTAPQNFEEAFDAPAPRGASVAQVASDAIRFVSEPAVKKAPVRNGVAPKADPVEAGLKADGSHLVQLGSFSSEQGARRAWGIYTKRYPELAGHQMVITQAVVRGKKYWRVSAGGYQKASASSMCSKVKGEGRGCFAWAEGRPMPGAVDTGIRMARR